MRNHIHLTSALLSLVCFAGCLHEPDDAESELEAVAESELASSSSSFAGAGLRPELEPGTALYACYPENTCGPEYTCYYEFDEQCGDPFCHQSGAQCQQTGGAGTFIRNEHVKYCWNAAGDFCVDADRGRDLLHCGC
jgi:hypothetical protein